jgi:uncharacterized Rmd1/YagE family protein
MLIFHVIFSLLMNAMPINGLQLRSRASAPLHMADREKTTSVGKKYPLSQPHFLKDNTPSYPVKRKARGVKPILRDLEIKREYGRCSVYCVGENLNISELKAHIIRQGCDGESGMSLVDRDMENMHESGPVQGTGTGTGSHLGDGYLHIRSSNANFEENDLIDVLSTPDMEESERHALEYQLFEAKAKKMLNIKDIIYFDYGVVVFWGLMEQEEAAALQELEQFTIDPVSSIDYMDGYDELQFLYDPKKNSQKPVRLDRMRLKSFNPMEKLALSWGIAQSSKLFIKESKIARRLEKMKYLPRELSSKGKITAGKTELNMLIGQLFVEQTEVNLFSSILDTPSFLWEDDTQEPVYSFIRDYLEVDTRVELLNKRLHVIESMLEVITTQVAERNSSRLEWIIISLISIEIMMGVLAMPLSLPKRLVGAVLVPGGILAYNRWRR